MVQETPFVVLKVLSFLHGQFTRAMLWYFCFNHNNVSKNINNTLFSSLGTVSSTEWFSVSTVFPNPTHVELVVRPRGRTSLLFHALYSTHNGSETSSGKVCKWDPQTNWIRITVLISPSLVQWCCSLLSSSPENDAYNSSVAEQLGIGKSGSPFSVRAVMWLPI